MKKSSPLALIIPLIIALLIVGSVFIARYFSPVPKTSQAAVVMPTPGSLPKLSVPTGKPDVGFSLIQPIEPVSDLRQALDGAKADDTSEFDSLEKEASSL